MSLKWGKSCFGLPSRTSCALISSSLAAAFRDISGSMCHNSCQTKRFYPSFVQPISSLHPVFITWPPLWLTVEGDWLTANILGSDNHSIILSSLLDPSVPEEKERRGFSHWLVDFLKSLCFVHGNGSKNQLNVQGFPSACCESLSDFGYRWWIFIKTLFGCQARSGELLCGSARRCVLIFWLLSLFKLTSYFQKEQTHLYLNKVILDLTSSKLLAMKWVEKHKTLGIRPF